jgi:putative transcriptional regulator
MKRRQAILLVNRIAKLRGKLITQAELAQELGLSRNTISKIETGKYAPTVDLAFKIKNVIEKLTLKKTEVTLRLSFEQCFLWVEDTEERKIKVEFPT